MRQLQHTWATLASLSSSGLPLINLPHMTSSTPLQLTEPELRPHSDRENTLPVYDPHQNIMSCQDDFYSVWCTNLPPQSVLLHFPKVTKSSSSSSSSTTFKLQIGKQMAKTDTFLSIVPHSVFGGLWLHQQTTAHFSVSTHSCTRNVKCLVQKYQY